MKTQKLSQKTIDLLASLKVHPKQPYDEVVFKAASLLKAFRTSKLLFELALAKDEKMKPELKEAIRTLFEKI